MDFLNEWIAHNAGGSLAQKYCSRASLDTCLDAARIV